MRHQRDNDRRLLNFARSMRAEPTDAERRMWSILRKHRLAGFRFRRQYPIEGYIVDYVCLEVKLIVEADGGQHCEPNAIQYDEVRSAILRDVGFDVIRFSDRDVLKDTEAVANAIYTRLMERASEKQPRAIDRPPPQPSPGVPGEGERR